MKILHSLLIFIFSLSLNGCKKEKVEAIFEVMELASGNAIQAIAFPHPDTGFAVGGVTYERGVLLQTVDAGASWSVDSVNDKTLNGLYFQSGLGWAAGFNGYIYQWGSLSANPDFIRTPEWNQLVDVCAIDAGVITISAVGIVEGIAYRWQPLYQLDTSFVFPFSLHAIDRAPDGTLHLVGFGAVLRSEDEGRSWIQNAIDGDNFQDVQFPSAETGYIVGYAGTILKTTDGGNTWEKLRNGGSSLVPDLRFRSLDFSSPERGALAGENGLLWLTDDGGESWRVLKNAPDLDFLDVVLLNDGGWLTTSNGSLVRFFE
ncbi:MAG: hypothetical protein GYB31_10090 [Bacteroidetes bacterium]|nr:hypothetical protein [Bacteroidota bacterium]